MRRMKLQCALEYLESYLEERMVKKPIEGYLRLAHDTLFHGVGCYGYMREVVDEIKNEYKNEAAERRREEFLKQLGVIK